MIEMKFGLLSLKTQSGQPQKNLTQIKRCIGLYRNQCDVLCFGESFLNGYSSLVYDPKEDIDKLPTNDDNHIRLLQVWAHRYQIALSFGYLEKEDDKIYSSYMFIGDEGQIINNYRRLTPSFNSKDETYSHGQNIETFIYKDRKFITLICEDLRKQAVLDKVKDLDSDVILWPIYMSSGEVFSEKSTHCVNELKPLVLMVNAFDEDAKGGVGVYLHGQLIKSLAENKEGIITVDDTHY